MTSKIICCKSVGIAVFLVTVMLVCWPLSAQQNNDISPGQLKGSDVTVDFVQRHIKRIEEDSQIEDTLKRELLAFYKEALENLKTSGNWEAKTKEFDSTIQNAPAMLKIIQDDMARVESESKLEIIARESSLTQLEQMLTQAEADLNAANKEINDLQIESKRRNDRKVEVPRLIAAAQQKLEELTLKFAGKPAPGASPEITLANNVLLLASRKAIQQEISAYEREILSYEVRTELLAARRDRAARRIAQAEKMVRYWTEVLNKRRRAEAEQEAKRARDEQIAAAQAHPLIRSITEENTALATLRIQLSAKIEKVSSSYDEVDKKLTLLKEEVKSLQDKVKAAGMTSVAGMLLRKKHSEIPDIQSYEISIANRQQETPDVQLKIIEFEEMRAELSDLEMEAQKIIGTLEKSQLNKEIQATVKERLQVKRNTLDTLLYEYNAYFMKLLDLDTRERQFVSEIKAYKDYIEEHILWIRSTSVWQWNDFYKAGTALGWLLSGKNWSNTIRLMSVDIGNYPLLYVVVLAICLSLIYVKSICQRTLQDLSALVAAAKTDSFLHTAKALLLTLAIGMTWPLLMWFIGLRMANAIDTSKFSNAIGHALIITAVVYVILKLLRAICIDKGLAQAHFHWDRGACLVVRNNLLWLMSVTLPLIFIETAMDKQANDAWKDSLGRMAFIISMVALAVFFCRILQPTGKLVKVVLEQRQDGWLERLSSLWYPAIILMPLTLAITAICGYYYTALQLQHRLWLSLLVILVVIVFYTLLLRWLFFITRTLLKMKFRKIAIPLQQEKTERNQEQLQQEENRHTMIQARRFLFSLCLLIFFVGLWMIWSDIFPALKILKKTELWLTDTTVTEMVKNADGSVTSQTISKAIPITLADVIYAILTIIITIVAVGNLPGLLEIFLLRRMRTEKSMNFAIVTLTKYVVVTLGVVIAFYAIGISWSKVQWLVAALTVGLGFGLQEILANFVSGLIILFEQPMRVGDIVTVGDVTGTVTKIRIRATIITNWDRKELIVPNKEFITGRLINWTLSDNILRLVIPVGIAYGSDTQLAQEQLLKVARENPDVLEDPQPNILFKSFGNSSLDFELRVYISSIAFYIKTVTDLHMEIDKAFRSVGIEIAFPQRDLHIRSICHDFPLVRNIESKSR